MSCFSCSRLIVILTTCLLLGPLQAHAIIHLDINRSQSVFGKKVDIITALTVENCRLMYLSTTHHPNTKFDIQPSQIVSVNIQELNFSISEENVEAHTISVIAKKKNPILGKAYPSMNFSTKEQRNTFFNYLKDQYKACEGEVVPKTSSQEELKRFVAAIQSHDLIKENCSNLIGILGDQSRINSLYDQVIAIQKFRERYVHDFVPISEEDFPSLKSPSETFEYKEQFQNIFSLFNNMNQSLKILEALENDLSNRIDLLDQDDLAKISKNDPIMKVKSVEEKKAILAYRQMMGDLEKLGGFQRPIFLEEKRYNADEWYRLVLQPGRLFHDSVFRGGEHGQETHRIQWAMYVLFLKQSRRNPDEIKKTVQLFKILGEKSFNDKLSFKRLARKNPIHNIYETGAFWDVLFDWVNEPNSNFHNPGYLRSVILSNPSEFPNLVKILKKEDHLAEPHP